MLNSWFDYQNDLNAMTDEEVAEETRRMEGQAVTAEAWLEAVAAWDAAGRPRHGTALTPRAPAQAEIDRLRKACARQNAEICQVLGKALGYPWFKDDPANFPDATEEHGVCVGDHVAESLADEAAKRIERLEAEVAAVLAAVPGVRFMDPPDGGDPKPHEEVQRMADALKAAEARAKGGGEWIRKGDALAAIDGAFAEHAAKIRAANAKRGGGLTMHGYDYLARAERARVIARDAISRATGAADAILALLGRQP